MTRPSHPEGQSAPGSSFEPLFRFYGPNGLLALGIEILTASEVPQPAHRLLCHRVDMTSTLGDFFGDRLDLQVRRRVKSGKILMREITLHLQSSNLVVEFGAIRIDLSQLLEEEQQLVCQGRIPLGAILNESGMAYRSRPSQFFRVKADAALVECLELSGPQVLYGRCNTLTCSDGSLLAKAVEVLPPLAALERFRDEALVANAGSVPV